MIRFASLARTLWPNGLGQKADIQTGDGWAIAFAWLDHDAAFSDYTGVDRTITLLDGPGFTLTFPQALSAPLAITQPHRPTDFDGGWPTHCTIAGHSLVLNAYTRRRTWRHSVQILDAPTTATPGSAEALIAVVLDGTLTINGDTAMRHDSIAIITPTHLAIAAPTRIALIRIEARS